MDIDSRLDIGKGLSSLKPERRNVLELKMQGLKEIEIAKTLKISLKKVKNHTFRGKEDLRKFFSTEDY